MIKTNLNNRLNEIEAKLKKLLPKSLKVFFIDSEKQKEEILKTNNKKDILIVEYK
jgi:hypothetical protein